MNGPKFPLGVQKILTVIFSLVLILLFAKFFSYHYSLITLPYPLEYREGAMLATTELLLKGQNPYSFESNPAYMNMYGILYNLIVYPFVKCGLPFRLMHRLISAVFIFASCFLLGVILRREKVPGLLIGCASLMFYAVLIYPCTTTPNAGPHSLGLFLFLLSVFYVYISQCSCQGLLLSVVCSILGFYAKPYAVLAAPFLAIYIFLFVSKMRGIVYGFLWGILLATSILIVNKIFPCYFGNTIFTNMVLGENNVGHMLEQFGVFFNMHWLTVIIFFVSIAILGLIHSQEILKITTEKIKIFKLNIFGFKDPLFNQRMDLFLFMGILMAGALYFKLGRHTGSWMAYYFHLLSPFFLIVLFRQIKEFKQWYLLIVPLILFNIFQISKKHEVDLTKGLEVWQQVKTLIDNHHNVFNSPIIAGMLAEEGRPIYDSGHSEYFKLGAWRTGPLTKKLFPPDKRFILRHYEYIHELKESVMQKKYDLVMLTIDSSALMPLELTQYYDYKGFLSISMPSFNQYFRLSVWTPKP